MTKSAKQKQELVKKLNRMNYEIALIWASLIIVSVFLIVFTILLSRAVYHTIERTVYVYESDGGVYQLTDGEKVLYCEDGLIVSHGSIYGCLSLINSSCPGGGKKCYIEKKMKVVNFD